MNCVHSLIWRADVKPYTHAVTVACPLLVARKKQMVIKRCGQRTNMEIGNHSENILGIFQPDSFLSLEKSSGSSTLGIFGTGVAERIFDKDQTFRSRKMHIGRMFAMVTTALCHKREVISFACFSTQDSRSQRKAALPKPTLRSPVVAKL